MPVPLKIVVIDDERDWIDLISRALSVSGLATEVFRFDDAESALEHLRTAHVDLVVTDLRMPGVDGRAFLRELRQSDRTTAIVLVSSEPLTSVQAEEFGANAFVPKAALKDRLAGTVSDLIALHQPRI